MDARPFAVLWVLVVSAALGLSRADFQPPASPVSPSLVENAVAALDVKQGLGICDLTLMPEAAIELVVASLGDSTQTYEVELSAEPIERLERSPRPLPEIASGHTSRRCHPTPLTFDSRRFSRRSGSRETSAEARDGGILTNSATRRISGVVYHPSEIPTSTAAVAAERVFYLYAGDGDPGDAAGYVPVAARLAGEGRHARVFLDRQMDVNEIHKHVIDELLREFDERVVPRSAELLGVHRDIDGDGKLTMLVTPWLGRLRLGKASAGGFVRSSDFQDRLPAPFSNRADVLYLNADLPTGDALHALLAHEYTHAVCISQRLPGAANLAGYPDEHDWLNEAIAHVAEYLHGAGWSNLDERIDTYLDNPARAPLVVPDYYRAGLWRDAGCRGATYLFLQWCVEQYGEDLLRQLVRNDASGVENLEHCTGAAFEDLFRRWTIALCQNSLRTLSLEGTLGRCDLRGLRRTEWRPSESSATSLRLRGTAAAFVRIANEEPHEISVLGHSLARRAGVSNPTHPQNSKSTWRIVVKSALQARLQITLVRSAQPSADADALSRAGPEETRPLAARGD